MPILPIQTHMSVRVNVLDKFTMNIYLAVLMIACTTIMSYPRKLVQPILEYYYTLLRISFVRIIAGQSCTSVRRVLKKTKKKSNSTIIARVTVNNS